MSSAANVGTYMLMFMFIFVYNGKAREEGHMGHERLDMMRVCRSQSNRHDPMPGMWRDDMRGLN
eukprot:CAMPEP_0174731268 /NCGR_PEP_ID=MMETSP1094-20130205/57201_1 /TAXON_ID=156173 /ORGANISM="Chrysochromulina brevifilum, Strain UTEX LB 985" /LENGTH=63 /DNA_ID=CAMNT_0015933631 /DNA_START=340 /DNA_END=529 /DNA_ORIENTATION=-